MALLSRLANIVRARVAVAFGDGSPDPLPPPPIDPAAASAGTANKGSAGRDPVIAGYYANLEIPYGSDLARVRQARKLLLRRYHPDLHSSDPDKSRVATEIVKRLNLAVDELSTYLSSRT